MTVTKQSSKIPLILQIEELKSKIALVEGNKKISTDKSENKISENSSRILELRKEIMQLRKNYAASLSSNENIIKQCFEGRQAEREALKNETGLNALAIMDTKLCNEIKKLNLIRYETACKEKTLQDLQAIIKNKESDNIPEMLPEDVKEMETISKIQNKMDRVRLKTHEANWVSETYEKIKRILENAALHYPNMLDAEEDTLKRLREELKKLKVLQEDAQKAKTAAMELQNRTERRVFTLRKKREIELQKLKNEAEDKTLEAEQLNRLTQNENTTPHEETSLFPLKDENESKMAEYDDFLQQIKTATSISDTKELVLRFENQQKTAEQLEKIKIKNEESLKSLERKKENISKKYELTKFTGDMKIIENWNVIQEFSEMLEKEINKKNLLELEFMEDSRTLVYIKTGIEHLSQKLSVLYKDVELEEEEQKQDEYLNMLALVQKNVEMLNEELKNYNLEEYEQMATTHEEVMEEKMLEGNEEAINLKSGQVATYEENQESGDDEGVLTREELKKQAKMLVETKSLKKRKGPKKR